MKRRTFLGCSLAATLSSTFTSGTAMSSPLRQDKLSQAAKILEESTASGQIAAAVMHVVQGENTFTRSFGRAMDEHAMFLLGSISKPIAVTALMTLYDRAAFKLDDLVKKYLPKFIGDGRDQVTIRHLLTHVSGLPDQLPENDSLRSKHASLGEFAEHAQRTPLNFVAGTKYQYSSMAILLSARIAEEISGTEIRQLVDSAVLQPLKMTRSAQGLGKFRLEDMVLSQTERAAPESGGGDPKAKDWDWNSPYWRKLGAPWGGTHASAPDIGRYLAEFLNERGAAIKPETARLMTQNHNPVGFTPRGLGLNVGKLAGSPGCSERTFGHTGSTGTICWADPASRTICVVLTSLPARAVQPHPRDLAAAAVASA